MTSPVPPTSSVLSFRPLVTEALSAFLEEVGLSGPQPAEVLAELVVSLSRHREEGTRLFPVAFLGPSLPPLLEVVGGLDPLPLGGGPPTRETAQQALRQCAPLCQGRWWAMYFELGAERMSYGVFRTNPRLLLATPLERLGSAPAEGPAVLGVQQLAENVVELRARAGLFRHVYLSGARVHAHSATQALETLAEACCADVPPPLRTEMQGFFLRVLGEVVQASHGALAAVLPAGQPIPPHFGDGVLLAWPVDLGSSVARYLTRSEVVTASTLRALAQLLRGMLATDGVTLLRSDGCLLGYNIFLPHPEGRPRPGPREGGARRRTYEVLCAAVGRGELTAAFFRSQDGEMACQRG